MSIPEALKMDKSLNNINWDFAGYRKLSGTQELVEYYKDSSCRIWLNDQTDDFPTHWHQALEIIMPVENYYDVTVGSTEFHLLPENILIIPPGELHSIKTPSWGQRFIFILDISGISTLKGFVGISALLTHPVLLTRETYPLIFDDIYQLLIKMRNEYFSNSDYAELMIQSMILNLFVKLGENHNNADELFPNVKLGKQREYVSKFNQLLEFIDEHYMEELTLESMASMAGFSKFHFSRLFKQYTDFTFCDYLCYRRIKAASELLAHPELSITEVALNSGFPSISTFNRLFKQQLGCTPREYRSKNQTYSRNK
ncbi:MAG: AraC family transcriptional regulator [Lachnospiraceae bacterium]|nr:AraC family transcriptional regulator [Lachnospiraceae bacterium]